MDLKDTTLSNEGFMWDGYGRFASGLCVLHCLTVSFAPSIIENISIVSAYNEVLEWGFFGGAVLFALISASLGLRKHQNYKVLVGFSIGLSVLTLGRVGEALSLFEGGEMLSICGGLFLFISHMYSTTCCRTA